MNIWPWVVGLVICVILLAAGVGYFVFWLAIKSRRSDAVPDAQSAPNEARRYYAQHFTGQMQWLRDWGYEEVGIVNHRGRKLVGYYFSAKNPTNKVCLAIHGYNSTGLREYMYYAPMYLEKLGMNLLLVDDEGHGQSEGKYIGFGYFDRLDCMQWANRLVEQLGQDCEILLQGLSMGAATVLMAAGEDDICKNVRWVLADCGYTCLKDEMMHLAKMPRMLTILPYKIASLWCRMLAGYFFGRANTLKYVPKIKVPTLFVHGQEDDFVPARMVQPLYDACNAPKTLRLVAGAAHVESFLADRQGYEDAIIELMRN